MRILSDTVLSLRIVLFTCAVPFLFRLPLRRLEGWVSPRTVQRPLDEEQAERVIRLTEGVCRATRRLNRRPCQVRGLTLYHFLRKAGVDVSLVFGIGKMGESYAGHCWLVKDGQPYLETVDPRLFFTPLYAVGGNAKWSRTT
jgi:hypothetical protein